jgi:tetratricopeptide (TPR) repeat protein/tRNA A-37 threonylcarbamoyl transferase component Bud32
MDASAAENTDREARLDEAIAVCLRTVEGGGTLAQLNLSARYPDLAAQLTEFFAGREQFQRLAAPWREVARAAAAGADEPETPPAPPLLPGQCFGDYEVHELLGEGGMAVVYKARQKVPDRLVALKMLRPELREAVADAQRLRNEADLIAQLDHPALVPLYEVGEAEGRFYFSMKLIEGGSLAGQVERFRNDLRAAASLVAAAARAVHHAHQRGILHRDLKPSNILLDADGRPHVTDFGLARRVEVDSTLTRSGIIVGTPSYMAPEQAAGRRAAITTATDVYGLGTILYELLTGRPPFQGESVLDTLVQVQEREPTPPGQNNPRVDRDLGTICLKCLEKESQRRYGSAEALAEDLERWLAGEPIEARPIGRLERATRWCRRKPLATAVIALAAVVAAILPASAFFIWQGQHEAQRQREKADEQRQRAQRYYRQARTVDQMLTRAAERLGRIPRMTEQRREFLQEVIKSYEGFLQEESNDPAVRQEMGKAYLTIGKVHNDLGNFQEAETAYLHAERIFDGLVQEFPTQTDYQADLVRSILGPEWVGLDNPEEAEQRRRRALPIQERLVAQHAEVPEYRHDLARLYKALAEVPSLAGRPAEARKAFRLALEIEEKLLADHPDAPEYRQRRAEILTGFGMRLCADGKYEEAEKLQQAALEIAEQLAQEFPDVPEYRNDVAIKHYFLGNLFAQTKPARFAKQSYGLALDEYAKLGADFPSLPEYQLWQPNIQAELGRLLRGSGNLSAAKKAFEDSLATYQKLSGVYPTRLWNRMSRINMSQTYGDLGDTLRPLGQLRQARQAYAHQQEVCEQALVDYPNDPLLRNNLAASHGGLGDLAGRITEAEEHYRKAIDIQEKLVADRPVEQLYRRLLAELHFALARLLCIPPTLPIVDATTVGLLGGYPSGQGPLLTTSALFPGRTTPRRFLEAERSYRRVVELFEQLVAEKPADMGLREQFAGLLTSLPDSRLRDPARAAALRSKAAEPKSPEQQ